MQRGHPSRTADAAAAVRAMHRLSAEPVLFDDPYAVDLVSPTWRRITNSSVLRWLVRNLGARWQGTVGAQVVARSRYAEDRLAEARLRGLSQYVIVGAGFDSYALRHDNDDDDHDRRNESPLRIFELDHPDTQEVKVKRITALNGKLPGSVEFLALDFEAERLDEALTRSRFDSTAPAFFSWLGTTPYLSREATLSTLRSIAACAAPGSELVFDYLVPDETLSESDRQPGQKMKAFAARWREPLIGEIDPHELESMLASVGFEMIENLSAAEQEARYFANRNDGLRPLPSAFIAHARVLDRAA